VILNIQLIECGRTAAINAFQHQVEPDRIEGLRYARTYLTMELRRGLLPSVDVTGAALFTGWDDQEDADRFRDHPVARRFAGGYELSMQPARSIGQLPGLPELPRREVPVPDGSPVAAYTVGKVKAARFLPFLKAAGAAEREAASHPGFLDGISIFRPPLVIGTFSLWRSLKAMRDYSLGSYPGGHTRAIEADRRGKFNSEMFFSRHIPVAAAGQWRGRDPLEGLLCSASSTGRRPRSAATPWP
jgi:hypothetical protein